MDIDVYRGIEKIYSLPIDERSIFVKKLMNEWYIEVETISNTALTFQIGDYITYNSENYTIYRLPDIEKINEKALRYTIQFESDMTLLNHKLFMWYGDELIDNEGVAEFDLNGTAEDFLDLVIKNINKTSSGWTKGTVDTTTEKTMSFTNEYCLAALVRIAEEFDLEFDIAAKVISLKGGIGTTTALTFEYGKGKGIYKLTRQQVQDQNILTRVYGFGSNRNIDYSYRSGLKKLIFKDGSNSYLDKNTELYGIIEGQYTNEDIYPHFEGTITAASIVFTDGVFDEESYIADSSIDFDLNSYLLEGTEAKIVFTSGDLSGVECVIRKFTAAADGELPANRVYFKASIDPEDSYPYPNYNGGTPIQPKVGDTFTFVDIKMPQAYIDAAELELKTATQTFLNENCVPQVVYTLDIDPKYAKTIAAFSVGDKVTVTDTQLGVDALIRISGVEFPLVNKYKIKATIADFVPYTLQERVIKSIINERKETRFVDRRRIESARINTIRQKQMKDMIFDADDYFDTVRIKPLSIETLYLAVGTKSSDFWLQGVTIHANYGGDENAIYVSGGILSHLQISIPELGADWVIGSDYTADTLADATGYYLYAKCSKSALTGEWVLSDAKIGVEDVSGYYHFYCGNLFPVLGGYRKFDFVKGMTYIVGDTITTGKIQSIDENCYLDLTNAKFRVGDSSTSLDWNVTTPNTLTIKGALVQSPAGTTFPMKVFRGAYDADTKYFKGDEVTYGGESWLYINPTATKGTTPVEGAYWTKSAAKGTNGTSAMTVKLTVDRQVFSYDSSGANPSPASCTLTAYATGISGTLYYQFLVDGSNKQNTTGSTYVYTPQADFTNMPDVVQVFVRSGSDSGTVLAQDMITVFGIKAAADGSDGTDGTNGIDAYTVVLTNEAHTLAAAYDGSVISFDGSGTDIYVFRGITPIPYDDTGANTFSVSIESGDAVNVTPGSVSTEGLYIRRYADLYAMSADNGSIKFTIKVRDANNVETTITRLQSFAKSRAGTDGENGTDGSSPALVYRGVYDVGETYYGNSSRVDAVKYNDTYWRAKITAGEFSAQTPSEGTYWTAFGASFESVATGLLLAEKALIENLAVKYYEGVSVGTGTLTGTAETVTPASAGVKRKDKITLTAGTIGGVAAIGCNGLNTQIFFDDNGNTMAEQLAATAASFVAAKATVFLSQNVTLTSDGADIYFEHTVAGWNFTSAAAISGATNPYQGGINIRGNDIWDDNKNGDDGTVCINRKGYNNGWTKYRRFYVFDGKGNYMMRIEGNIYGGAINFHAASAIFNGDFFEVAGTQLYLPNLPTSDPGVPGMVWIDQYDNTLKISQ